MQRIFGGDSEDTPELVRLFYSDRECSESCHGKVQHCNGFDYKAATELLRKNPGQVRFVNYECKTTGPSRTRDGSRIKRTSNQCMNSPLRWACIETTKEAEAMEFLKTIRGIDPTRFLLQDSHGDLPIDGECILNASIEMLSFLLDIYLDYDFFCPNGVGMTEANFNPMTCLCGSYWWEDIHQANEAIRSGAYVVSGTNVQEDNLGIEDNFWERIILLAKAFYHRTIQDDEANANDNKQTRTNRNKTTEKHESSSPSMLRITNAYGDRRVKFRLLHACAGIDWFPPNLLRLLVAAFPRALLERDEDGNLPIHVAAGGLFESYKIDANWEGDFEANSGYQKTTIDIFLEANPDLARIKDAEGRLPIELALERQFDEDHCHNPRKRLRPWEDGGIGSILEAYPRAAEIRSPVTKRLPLEMALGGGSYRDWEDGIKDLLRAYPEAAGLKNPTTGKYPLQLAIERKTHFDEGVYGLLEAFEEAAGKTVVVSANYWNSKSNSSMPLFALAALENCSASVVYKILRTNPSSCQRFEMRMRQYREQKQTINGGKENHKRPKSLLPPSMDGDLPSSKRSRILTCCDATALT